MNKKLLVLLHCITILTPALAAKVPPPSNKGSSLSRISRLILKEPNVS